MRLPRFLSFSFIAGLTACMASTSCKAQPSNRDKTAKANVEQAKNEWLNPNRIKVGSPVFIRII